MTNDNIYDKFDDLDDFEIPTILAFDVGNTTIRFACIKSDEVTEPGSCQLGELAGFSGKIKSLWDSIPEPKEIVACSVNASGTKALEAAVSEAVSENIRLVGRDIPLPIETDLADPNACGTDRLCAAIAAFDRLGTACIIADFGSAITIDCVNDEGVFLGGAILPGLEMSTSALHQNTCQLPQV